MRASLWRGVALVLLVVLAAVAGAVSGFVHRTTLELGVEVPVGLAAALAALGGLLVLARFFGRSRAAVLVVAAAYLLPVLLLSQFRPEGDLVIAEDAWGLSLLAGSGVVATVAVVVPVPTYDGRDRASTDRAPQPSPRAAHEVP